MNAFSSARDFVFSDELVTFDFCQDAFNHGSTKSKTKARKRVIDVISHANIRRWLNINDPFVSPDETTKKVITGDFKNPNGLINTNAKRDSV